MPRITLLAEPRCGFFLPFFRLISEDRFSKPRLIAFILILALVMPMMLVARQERALAAPKSAISAPRSAPPAPFVIHTPAYTMATLASAMSFASLVTDIAKGPQAPAGLGMAKVPSRFDVVYNAVSTALGFAKPTAAAGPAPPPQPASVVDFDFDNDGSADIGRWHGANTEFKVKNSNGGSFSIFTLGSSGATIAPGDFNGDGKTDAAVFSGGTWTYKTSTGASAQTISWGQSGDIPVAGDYDGDGTTDAAVYRPSTNTWWVLKSTGGHFGAMFGASGDIVTPGDFDGDGKNDLAVYRPSTGYWHIHGTTAGYYSMAWGIAIDTPVAADYDGDGKTDPAVFRPTTGEWFAYRSGLNNGSYYSTTFGNYADQPVPADYDGDNKADFSVWRPTTGVWYTIKSSDSSTTTQTLGVPGDTAVPSAYLKQVGGAVTGDDLAAARLAPRNATGGTNLYSQNFSWSRSLVSLPGRSGLDAGLGIGYNSLVWTKVGSAIVFDADVSNASPGFRFGFPVIEPVHYDGTRSDWAYMMVSPSGARTQFIQVDNSNVYETADSSYTQLVTTGATNPNDPVENITSIKVTSTDGTQMTYVWNSGVFRCTQIKDRNGNYITAAYNGDGQLTSVTDTLSRVINISYSGNGYPSAITQTWKDTNGSGSNVTHTWATFAYTDKTVDTDFSGLTVIGPPDTTDVDVLDKITYADGSFTKFEYSGYLQVKKISNVAADSTSHVLNYVSTNLDSPSSGQTDCPRFTETRSWVENFNMSGSTAQEVVVTNSLSTGQTYSLPGSITGSATRIDVAMTGHPDGLYSRTFVGGSGWQEGLPIATEDCIGSNCADRKRWTWTGWDQDNTSLSYMLNPRVEETLVGDGTNTKRTTVDYDLASGNISQWGLVSEMKVYDTDLSTVLKEVESDYNLSSTYTDRRIIGLASEVRAYGRETSGLNLMSRVTYAYDEGNFIDSGLQQSITPTQHDTNYDSSYIAGRGNLTSTTRWDVTASTDSSLAITSSTKYNTAGSPVAKITPWDGTNTRTVRVGYADNFNSTVGVSTYAYPTVVTDPAGSSLGDSNHSSTLKYRYDIGTNVEANSPAPAGNSTGKRTVRTYDDTYGDLLKDAVWKHDGSSWGEHAYTRYEYPTTGIQSKVFSTLVNEDGDSNIAEDEVLSETFFDGAGRVRMARVPHTFSSGSTATWAGTITEYDILGRVARQSVPTEVNSSWAATGDDATRGFLWKHRKYDWMGRVVRKINTDGIDQTALNDSDVLISYDGCGCAGGLVTTIEGELVPNTDSGSGNARRKQKIYEDILGRTEKTETFLFNGSTVYSTVTNTYNGRDQIVSTKQYDGTTSGTMQETTATFDGHGRLSSSHKPEQRDGSTLKYTNYTYNTDGSLVTMTDARGAATVYTYNSRALVTNVAWTVPGGSGIPDPTDVTFAYDNLGNRTNMTDGMGEVDYEYNSLSQLTGEVRDFTDTLTDAPNGVFRLEYAYEIGGQLKSYTDPYGDQIGYTNDKVGRLNTVTGSTFDGTTEYAENPQYRAWGGLKHLEYGNGNQVELTYNAQLKPVTMLSNSIASPTSELYDRTYDYYSDGRLKTVDEHPETLSSFKNKYDRLFTYDSHGRVKDAKSGVEAHGQTETDYLKLPYRQTYAHDAFNHVTSRSGTLWNYGDWEFAYSYTNNRVTNSGFLYDFDGRTTQGDGITYKYDAAGGMLETKKSGEYETVMGRDGLNKEAKRAVRTWDDEENEWDEWKTAYLIFSTALGQIITEAADTGKKKATYVFGAGTLIAKQGVNDEAEEHVGWLHRDASGLSAWPSGFGPGAGTMPREELEGLGSNVGHAGQLTPPDRGTTSPSPFDTINFGQVLGDCELDGILMPCSMISRLGEALELEHTFWRNGTYHRERIQFNRDLPGRVMWAFVREPGNGNQAKTTETFTVDGKELATWEEDLPDIGQPGTMYYLNAGWKSMQGTACERMVRSLQTILDNNLERLGGMGRMVSHGMLDKLVDAINTDFYNLYVPRRSLFSSVGGGPPRELAGEDGFKTEFQEGNPNVFNDQTHHFAAYFSSGLMLNAKAFFHETFLESNKADIALGRAAYSLGADVAARQVPSTQTRINRSNPRQPFPEYVPAYEPASARRNRIMYLPHNVARTICSDR